MTDKTNRDDLMQRLTDVIDAYGGDRNRWPEADQRRLEVLLSGDDQARKIIEDGAALDRLLTSAEAVETQRSDRSAALADRIMANIEDAAGAGQESAARPSATIISLPNRRASEPVTVERPVLTPSAWLPVAALAASLMVGIFVGAGGYLESTASSLTELAGLSTSSEALPVDDGFGPVDEEYL